MAAEFTSKSPIQKKKNMKRAVENSICHRKGRRISIKKNLVGVNTKNEFSFTLIFDDEILFDSLRSIDSQCDSVTDSRRSHNVPLVAGILMFSTILNLCSLILFSLEFI
jgi:hypothetical protein